MKNLLKNRYEIIGEIGLGASGSVSAAIDIFTQSKIAIKRIPLSSSIQQIKRLERECWFLKKVSHPNLIKAYDFFIEENNAYMVLEYVYGKSLDDIIKKNKYSMSLVGQLAIANQVARGIEVLNIGGIIHRDIKPQNIMFNTKTGEIKILDLGIAKNLNKELASLTSSGEIIGTCAYMSPEQTQSNVGNKTDIFSLGVLLHQFFTWSNNSPFATGNVYATINKIRIYKPADICSVIDLDNATPLQRDAYEKIAAIITKAIHKEPDMRWKDAGEIADLFGDIQQGLLGEVKEQPEKYKVLTSRQISPKFRKMLLDIRLNHSLGT